LFEIKFRSDETLPVSKLLLKHSADVSFKGCWYDENSQLVEGTPIELAKSLDVSQKSPIFLQNWKKLISDMEFEVCLKSKLISSYFLNSSSVTLEHFLGPLSVHILIE